MPKKKRAEDITWFNISNYEVLADLTVGEFCRELSNRVFLWDTQKKGNDKNLLVFFTPWLQVLDGKIELGYGLPSAIDTLGLTDPDNLFISAEKLNLGVKLVTQKLLDGIHEYSHKSQFLFSFPDINKVNEELCFECSCLLMSISRTHSDGMFDINPNHFCTPCINNMALNQLKYNLILKDHDTCLSSSESESTFIDLNYYLNRKGNLLTIDLETYSDEELIKQLRSELPKFRALLKIPEPTIKYQKKTTNNHLQQMIKNAFTYQLIPVLDLKLFQFLPSFHSPNTTIENKTVFHEQILDLVFKDDENRDKDWMRKTLIKKYMNPLLDPDVIKNILTYVKVTPSLSTQLMSEFMKK